MALRSAEAPHGLSARQTKMKLGVPHFWPVLPEVGIATERSEVRTVISVPREPKKTDAPVCSQFLCHH
jgi:hypothetical protein